MNRTFDTVMSNAPAKRRRLVEGTCRKCDTDSLALVQHHQPSSMRRQQTTGEEGGGKLILDRTLTSWAGCDVNQRYHCPVLPCGKSVAEVVVSEPCKANNERCRPIPTANDSGGGLRSMPDDILFLLATWVTLEDVPNLARTCRRWHNIYHGGPTSRAVWEGIATCRHPFLERIWRNARGAAPAPPPPTTTTTRAALSDSQLWIDVLKSRETSVSLRPNNTVDVWRPHPRPGATNSIVRPQYGPMYETRDNPSWLGNLDSYRFAVHVWDLMGAKHTLPVDSACFSFGAICMKLGENSSVVDIGRTICEDQLHGLEIEVTSLDERHGKFNSAIIYSGLLPFEAYGGDNYSKFAAQTAFCTSDVDDDNCCSFGWVPFAAPPFAMGGWKLGEGNTLALEMEWRHRKDGGQYERQEAMQPPDVLTFLKKGLVYTKPIDPVVCRWTLPRCIGREGRLVTGLTPPTYRPKPMSSYAFVIDVTNDAVTPRQSCSLYYETCKKTWYGNHGDRWRYDKDWSSMFFSLTPECRKVLPGFDEVGEFLIDEREATVEVYVVDKATGRQAKLYSSRDYKVEWSWADWGNFYAFEKYSAVTYFSTDSGDGIPVPSVRAMYHGDNDLWVNLNWFCSESDPALIDMTEEELLIFLDNGLVYV